MLLWIIIILVIIILLIIAFSKKIKRFLTGMKYKFYYSEENLENQAVRNYKNNLKVDHKWQLNDWKITIIKSIIKLHLFKVISLSSQFDC